MGRYVFTDFYTKRLSAITWNPVLESYEAETLIVNTGRTVSHFAQGHDGEVYLLDYDNGSIWRIEPQ